MRCKQLEDACVLHLSISPYFPSITFFSYAFVCFSAPLCSNNGRKVFLVAIALMRMRYICAFRGQFDSLNFNATFPHQFSLQSSTLDDNSLLSLNYIISNDKCTVFIARATFECINAFSFVKKEIK